MMRFRSDLGAFCGRVKTSRVQLPGSFPGRGMGILPMIHGLEARATLQGTVHGDDSEVKAGDPVADHD